MENALISMGIKVKGEIVIEKVVDNVIVDTIKATNTWLDQGTRQIINNFAATSVINVYMNVSSYSGAVAYTDSSIPNVLVSVLGTRTYESTPKRHKFVGVITAPVGSPRTINAAGLSASSGGGGAYCYTVLSTPVVQQTTETLYVYYYIYIQQPLIDGFGWSGYSEIASKWFEYSYFPSVYWAQRLIGDVKINENNYSSGVLLGPRVLQSSYYSMGWTGQVGDSANLTTNLGFMYGMTMIGAAAICNSMYAGSAIGRVWAKAKTSTADFFDSSNLPLGWGKAINVRAAVLPYDPDAFVSLMAAQISVSGAVGVGKYYLTASVADVIFAASGVNQYATMEIITKFGRNWFVAGMCSTDSPYPQYLYLCNIDTGGSKTSLSRTPTTNEALYAVYDNFVGLENVMFGVARTNAKMYKYDMSTGVKTEYTLPWVMAHAVGLSVDNLIYCWSSVSCAIGTCDPFTGVFVGLYVTSMYWMGYMPTGARLSWGGYDSDKDYIMMEYNRSLVLYDRLRINNVSNFSGVADFSGTTIKDWSKIVIGEVNGALSYSGGKLLLTTSKGYLMESSAAVTAVEIGQLINAGTFEVTCCIESFDPTVNYQEIGLLVSPVIGAYTTHKRIGTQYNSAKQLAVKDNVGGALVTIEGTVAFTGVYVRFKITRDGSDVIRCYYSTDPISTPDPSATWTLLGNQTYVLSGKVIVGLYGLTRAGATVATGTISDFRVNSGVVDKIVNVIYLNRDVVNESSRISRYGTVLKKDGYYHCLTTTHVVMVDAITLNLYSEIAHGGASVDKGYVYDNDCYPVAVLFTVTNYQYVMHLCYDSILDTWISMPVLAANYGLIPSKKGFFVLTSLGSVYYGMGYKWDWNGSDWVLSSSASPVGKLTHSDWQNIPFGLQLRCCTKVSNPNATFNSADKYSWMFCQNGIIKDNVQYVTNIAFQLYFGNSHFEEESYTAVPVGFTLDAKLNNAATWLTVDLGMAWEFKFKDAISGAYSYWNSILTSNNVDSVTSKSEFTSDDADLNWAYNYYNGNWVKFTTGNNSGIARQITEYDGYNKKFVTTVFPGDIVIGDLFDIVSPADATQVTSDAIPTMTSNTTPSGICSSSYDNVNAYKLFDENVNTYLDCPKTSLPWTITYEFAAVTSIQAYSVYINDITVAAPKAWTFQAWDGGAWVVLDTQSNMTWSTTNEGKGFAIANVNAYIKYKIVVTDWVGGVYTTVRLGQLYMYVIPANYFYMNGSLGQVMINASDVGKNADLKYVWVGRSW